MVRCTFFGAPEAFGLAERFSAITLLASSPTSTVFRTSMLRDFLEKIPQHVSATNEDNVHNKYFFASQIFSETLALSFSTALNE
jgi:hypothetical protein